MVAGFKFNVLAHIPAAQNVFVVESNSLASAENVNFLAVGKFVDAPSLADGLEDGGWHDQGVLTRPIDLAVHVVALASDLLDSNGDQRLYYVLSKRFANLVLHFHRRHPACFQIAYQSEGEHPIFVNHHGTGELAFIPDMDVQHIGWTDFV